MFNPVDVLDIPRLDGIYSGKTTPGVYATSFEFIRVKDNSRVDIIDNRTPILFGQFEECSSVSVSVSELRLGYGGFRLSQTVKKHLEIEEYRKLIGHIEMNIRGRESY